MIRILAISSAAWDDRNSVGNTNSNLLGGMPNIEIYHIYSREALPFNHCCTEYYTITVGDIVRHFFCPWKIGRRFSQKCGDVPGDSESAIEKANESIQGWKRNVALFVLDCVYNTKIWLNSKTKAFVKEANPDVVFCFAIADAYRYQILKYIKKY